MTRKEMTEIFSIMLLAYPNAEVFKGGIDKLGPTISLWTQCLPEIDFWTGQKAVIKLCRECKYPPTIAEFREKAENVESEIKAEIDAAWSMVRLSLRFDNKTPQEVFAELPEGSRSRASILAMGGPERLLVEDLHHMGDGTVKTSTSMNFDGFAQAYRALLRGNAQEIAALPSGKKTNWR